MCIYIYICIHTHVQFSIMALIPPSPLRNLIVKAASGKYPDAVTCRFASGIIRTGYFRALLIVRGRVHCTSDSDGFHESKRHKT